MEDCIYFFYSQTLRLSPETLLGIMDFVRFLRHNQQFKQIFGLNLPLEPYKTFD